MLTTESTALQTNAPELDSSDSEAANKAPEMFSQEQSVAESTDGYLPEMV